MIRAVACASVGPRTLGENFRFANYSTSTFLGSSGHRVVVAVAVRHNGVHREHFLCLMTDSVESSSLSVVISRF